MSRESSQSAGPDPPPAASSRDRGWFQTDVRGLIAIVACCAVVLWAARSVRESQNPTLAAARGLQSPDSSDRVDAASRLVLLKERDPLVAIPALIDAMDDRMPRVRMAAADALGAINEDTLRAGTAWEAVCAAVARLIRALEDPAPLVRLAAINSLTATARAPVRGPAASIDRRAIVDVFAGLLDDGDDEVRLRALYGVKLCGSGLDNPPAALVAALEDRSPRIRAAAIRALAGFGCDLDPWLPYLLRDLEENDLEVSAACMEAVARVRPPFSPAAIPALVAALGSRSQDVRSRVVRALVPLARDPRAAVVIPPLLALLREPIDLQHTRPTRMGAMSEGYRLRAAALACEVLGKAAPGTPMAGEVVAALVEVVRSGDPERRASAATALAEFGPAAESILPTLVRIWREDLAREDGAPYLECEALAQALARIAPGTPSADAALAALIEALGPRPEGRPGMRQPAVEALPAFGAAAARALPRLRDWQKAPYPQLRTAADRAVAAIELAVAANECEHPAH